VRDLIRDHQLQQEACEVRNAIVEGFRAEDGQDLSVKKSRSELFPTERALRDIAEIERDSVSRWGNPTAAKSRQIEGEIEAARCLHQENPALLRTEAELHPICVSIRSTSTCSFALFNETLSCC